MPGSAGSRVDQPGRSRFQNYVHNTYGHHVMIIVSWWCVECTWKEVIVVMVVVTTLADMEGERVCRSVATAELIFAWCGCE